MNDFFNCCKCGKSSKDMFLCDDCYNKLTQININRMPENTITFIGLTEEDIQLMEAAYKDNYSLTVNNQ